MSRVTVKDLAAKHAAGEKIVAISLYDALMARLADAAGAHLLLVGDSMGNAILGHRNTIGVTLEQSLHHTAAVVRGASRAIVVGDMPFLTYRLSADDALRNAGRYLQEAGAEAVKLEGGRELAPLIVRMVAAGIPVMGHIGMLPQRILVQGGARIEGRTQAAADSIVEDALALQQAGVMSVVLECIPAELARRITEIMEVPTIGIGAGPNCSGQIQVVTDLLGMDDSFCPRHAKQYAALGAEISAAFAAYAAEVESGAFPAAAHTSA